MEQVGEVRQDPETTRPRCTLRGIAFTDDTPAKICLHQLDAVQFADLFWDEA